MASDRPSSRDGTDVSTAAGDRPVVQVHEPVEAGDSPDLARRNPDQDRLAWRRDVMAHDGIHHGVSCGRHDHRIGQRAARSRRKVSTEYPDFADFPADAEAFAGIDADPLLRSKKPDSADSASSRTPQGGWGDLCTIRTASTGSTPGRELLG